MIKTIKRLFQVITWLFLAALIAACGEGTNGNSGLLANQDGETRGGAQTAIERFRASLNSPSGDQRRLGTDEFIGEGPRGNRNLFDVTDEGEITLNLVNVPIEQAAQAVLGQALRKNYTIQPGVTGQVTLQTTRPLTERALLETFQTILELNGATLQTSGDLITIVPVSGAARRVENLGRQSGIGSRVVAVPLRFIGTAEMVRLLEPITGSTVGLQPIPRRNILLISGTRDEINSAIEAVNLFDVNVLQGKSVGLYRLRAAEPEAVVEELNLIFETGDGGSLQNVVTFVPSQRLGAVLVISSRSSYLPEAERWIRDLDRTAGGAKRRPVVYSLQNRSADELAPILAEMVEDVAAEEGASVAGTPKVVADDARNAVIVWGNDSEQESFSRLIQSLDTTPVQVLLEATIAEVTLNDELNFGLRWFFQNGDDSIQLTDASNGSFGANVPGLSLLFQGGSSVVTLNALSSVTDVNVVSSPSLLVLDNQEARLQIGDEVPIATQQVRDTGDVDAPVVNTISFRDTGIILSVKPRVSSSGQVILDIEQEVSTVSQTETSGIDSPTISQRRIETSVVVTDGQTLALGGLIQENRNRTNSQVPGLGRAKGIGALFRNRSDTVGKTELLVLITPKVIRNGSESRSVTNELRQRINGANGLVRNGIGAPNDGHRIID
ncbi:type II secretion system secretin GspD [Pseudaestuariivita rosea]|uniref:type II secretion system secretin GspD n=1 Tax=Pseudaestuariivita rosea TaxID=2763263 RepID=UPI001ABBCA90|nr:type II secretion system secretin GspD [Pseudaestuariivita rosea]